MASGAGNPRVGLALKYMKRFASCANIRLAFNVRDARIDYEESVAFAMFDQRQS
jgi:hypothetical protein